MKNKKMITIILKKLKELYPEKIEQRDPYKVLIETILSQRTKDENTKKASKKLFSKYDTIEKIANAQEKDLEKLIRCVGFYRVKAKRIKKISKILINKYDGKVPKNLKELLKLPGVGRKTANCVLVYGFNEDAIPVDTHVHRVANRIGLVNTKTPEETEKTLRKIIPRDYWKEVNKLFVEFGKNICKPTNPKHEKCPIKKFCKYVENLEV